MPRCPCFQEVLLQNPSVSYPSLPVPGKKRKFTTASSNGVFFCWHIYDIYAYGKHVCSWLASRWVFNPFEKYWSNWIISPGKGKHTQRKRNHHLVGILSITFAHCHAFEMRFRNPTQTSEPMGLPDSTHH